MTQQNQRYAVIKILNAEWEVAACWESTRGSCQHPGLFRNPGVGIGCQCGLPLMPCAVSFLINTALGGKRPQLPDPPRGRPREAGGGGGALGPGGGRDPEWSWMRAAPSSPAPSGPAAPPALTAFRPERSRQAFWPLWQQLYPYFSLGNRSPGLEPLIPCPPPP